MLQAEISYAEIVGGRLRTPSWRSLKTDPKKRGVMVPLKPRRGFNVSLPVSPEPAGG